MTRREKKRGIEGDVNLDLFASRRPFAVGQLARGLLMPLITVFATVKAEICVALKPSVPSLESRVAASIGDRGVAHRRLHHRGDPAPWRADQAVAQAHPTIAESVALAGQFFGSCSAHEDTMIDTGLLQTVAAQLMASDEVVLNGKSLRVRRTTSSHLRIVSFSMGGRAYDAIEQNPEKPSRWGQLAREGHQVVQFRDAGANRFIAVAVDGKVKVYGGRAA